MSIVPASPVGAEENTCFDETPEMEIYRQNYLLPLTHDFKSQHNGERQSKEILFQFSFRKNILSCRWFPLYFGYTQKSFWQAYDRRKSSPFRENNFNPELFLDFDLTVLKESDLTFQFGLWEHESNGRSGEFSRSWNRSYLKAGYRLRPFIAALKIWNRWNEDPKDPPDSAEGDDNPEIVGFIGSWELKLYALLWDYLESTLTVRKRVRPDNPTAQLDLDFFIGNNSYIHLQYFHGYGESLIDLDREVSRISLGFAVRKRSENLGRNRVR